MSSEPGRELSECNHKIVKCIQELKEQSIELGTLIEKQEKEKEMLKAEQERVIYKLALINKSLGQRIKAKVAYDKTIEEAERNYEQLVKSSGLLLDSVQITAQQLTEVMDKRVGTIPETPVKTSRISKKTDVTPKKQGITEEPNIITEEEPETAEGLEDIDEEPDIEELNSVPVKVTSAEVYTKNNNNKRNGEVSNSEINTLSSAHSTSMSSRNNSKHSETSAKSETSSNKSPSAQSENESTGPYEKPHDTIVSVSFDLENPDTNERNTFLDEIRMLQSQDPSQNNNY